METKYFSIGDIVLIPNNYLKDGTINGRVEAQILSEKGTYGHKCGIVIENWERYVKEKDIILVISKSTLNHFGYKDRYRD